MIEFSIHSDDYRRYGLDDRRCSVRRPTGLVLFSIEPSCWRVATETIQWVFGSAPSVRKLHDCFLVHFTNEEILAPGLSLLIPLKALSKIEVEVLEGLSQKRHPGNSVGDFYGIASECGCIGACAPSVIAPELIGYQEQPEGCYFVRQPRTKVETDHAIEAVLGGMDNLRYGGSNPNVIQRIRAGTRNVSLDFCQDDVCDYPTEDPNRGAA